jgi:hypothetical protein
MNVVKSAVRCAMPDEMKLEMFSSCEKVGVVACYPQMALKLLLLSTNNTDI